jgi:putative DNA primase/helicase
MDDGYMIHDRGLKMIRGIYGELLKTADYRDRLDIEKYAIQSESVRRRKAFVEAASWIPELNIRTDDLDKDPCLLNVENGTVDLRMGNLREQRAEDLITKFANVRFDPAYPCPVWKQFVREIMNYNADLIKFIQTAVGWAVTGDTSEQTMFILFGSGANGKSTFLNTVMNLLGNYAIATPTETFMRKSGEQITNDIARLRGDPVCYHHGGGTGEAALVPAYQTDTRERPADRTVPVRGVFQFCADLQDIHGD